MKEGNVTTEVTDISIFDIKIPPYSRALKPYAVDRIVLSMKDHGYNIAYPIVIEKDGTLVAGRHRVAAAQQLGIERVPCIYKPADTSAIRFGLESNADGQLCAADDVFDIAELCAALSHDGWTQTRIAEELGWERPQVARYAGIKKQLHPRAWTLARDGVPRIQESAQGDGEDLGTRTVPNGTPWSEWLFRAFLKHLPWEDGDRVAMRAQMAAVRELLGRLKADTSFTAPRVEAAARKHAWHATLARYMRDQLVKDVPLSARRVLLRAIKDGVYGHTPPKESDGNAPSKFALSIAALNEKATGARLFCDDALERIPAFEDKSFALVIADPPYNVTALPWDQVGTAEEYLEWTTEWLRLLRPKLQADYHLFLFCSAEYQARIENLLLQGGWPLQSRVIWSHRNLAKGRQVINTFISSWDMVFHCGTHDLNWPDDWTSERFDVQTHAIPQTNFVNDPKVHQVQKPLALIELLVRIGSKPGDGILDPFAGGGTTGEACVAVGQRRCVLIEKEPTFCRVIENRLGIKVHESTSNE